MKNFRATHAKVSLFIVTLGCLTTVGRSLHNKKVMPQWAAMLPVLAISDDSEAAINMRCGHEQGCLEALSELELPAEPKQSGTQVAAPVFTHVEQVVRAH